MPASAGQSRGLKGRQAFAWFNAALILWKAGPKALITGMPASAWHFKRINPVCR